MDTDMSKREAEEIIGEAEKKPFVADSASGESSHAVNEGAKASDVAAETALSNKPVLYHIQHYSSSTPWIVIEELGIKDKIRIQECKNDEHKTGEAGAHNPHGFVRIACFCRFFNSHESLLNDLMATDTAHQCRCLFFRSLFPRNTHLHTTHLAVHFSVSYFIHLGTNTDGICATLLCSSFTPIYGAL